MTKGILCAVGASLLFGIIPSANKFVIESGVSALCQTFYAKGLVCLLSLIIILVKKIPMRVHARQVFSLIALGAVGMGVTSFLLSSATIRISVGLATVLHFLYPTIVATVMVVMFGQIMTKYKLMAIVCSISGMLLITNMQGGAIRWDGIILAVASSMTYSLYMIANEKGEFNELPLIVKLFYCSMGSTVVFGIMTINKHSATLPETMSAMLVLGVCGLTYLAAYYLITAGIKQIGASKTAFVNMLEPITGIVVSAIIYRERPNPAMFIGMLLILLSVFMVAMDGRATSNN